MPRTRLPMSFCPADDSIKAVGDYQGRQRRFGGAELLGGLLGQVAQDRQLRGQIH
jgi:hypothetical protein